MMKIYRLGVIGAGRIGKIHAENLATRVPGVVVGAIADVNLQAAQEVAERLQIASVYEDYHSILADPSIDAVAICSSTDTHAKIVVEGARAGKHIFCEKPIDFDLPKIDMALDAVKKAGVKRKSVLIGASTQTFVNCARWSPKEGLESPISYESPAATLNLHPFRTSKFQAGCSLI